MALPAGVPPAPPPLGDLDGHHPGTNDIGWELIAFDSLASYERYSASLKSDKEACENLATVQTRRVIVREERSFAEVVAGAFGLPSARAGAE